MHKEIVKVHSKLGASSMERWSKCPGSVELCEKMPKSTSVYAEEGTKAHELAEFRLRAGTYPPNVDDEMVEAVQVYVDYVEDLWSSLEKHRETKILIEHRFDLNEVHPGLFGTCDCVIYDGKNEKLYVLDYKHGQGIPVEPEGNLQLIYYGLGAALSLKVPIKKIVLGIIQPRYSIEDAVKTTEIDLLDLLSFRMDLKEAAVRTEEKNPHFETGDQCRFCSAKPICPVLRKEAELAVKKDFAVQNLSNLSQDTVGELLQKLDTIEVWTKGVREFAYQEAKNGRAPTGFKLVPKRATRKWADMDKTNKEFSAHVNANKLRDLYTEPELKSPAQVEKILGKTLQPLVDKLTIMVSSGDTLVAESDKREAVNTKHIAEQMFGNKH